MATYTVPDFTPSMEAQNNALRATAITVTQNEIAYHERQLARLRTQLAKFKRES